MNQVKLLEKHISELDDASFAKLRVWFTEFDQARWDKKLEADSNAGKLGFLIDAALAEHQNGFGSSYSNHSLLGGCSFTTRSQLIVAASALA